MNIVDNRRECVVYPPLNAEKNEQINNSSVGTRSVVLEAEDTVENVRPIKDFMVKFPVLEYKLLKNVSQFIVSV